MGAKRVLYCHECGAPGYRIKDWIDLDGEIIPAKGILNLDYTSIGDLIDLNCPQCGYVIPLRKGRVQ